MKRLSFTDQNNIEGPFICKGGFPVEKKLAVERQKQENFTTVQTKRHQVCPQPGSGEKVKVLFLH